MAQTHGISMSKDQVRKRYADWALWSVPPADLPLRRFAPDEAWQIIARRFEVAERPGGIAGTAFDRAIAFLAGPRLPAGPAPVLGHGDPNLANYLWEAGVVRIVDFEDAGRSDVAYELATLVEHLSARATGWDGFLRGFDVDQDRLRTSRALVACQWLRMLLPGGVAAARNPPSMLDRQAVRLLGLLDG